MRRSDQRRLAVFALYQHDLTGRKLDELFDRDTSEFTWALAEQTLVARDELDETIKKFIKEGWSLERIAPLERNILRVAVNELYNRDETPREVAVNEAIELAKRYCSADAPKFVNGILGSVLRDMPPLTSEQAALQAKTVAETPIEEAPSEDEVGSEVPDVEASEAEVKTQESI